MSSTQIENKQLEEEMIEKCKMGIIQISMMCWCGDLFLNDKLPFNGPDFNVDAIRYETRRTSSFKLKAHWRSEGGMAKHLADWAYNGEDHGRR